LQWRHLVTLSPCHLVILVFCLPACQQQMAVQPSARPDPASSFFPDGRSDRPLIPGTVARGHLRIDTHFFAGRKVRETRDWTLAAAILGAAAGPNPLGAASIAEPEQKNLVQTFPFPVTQEVLEHGQNRYIIFCVVCHDALGTGRGKIVERSYTQPPSYHIERLRSVAVGHFFDVITNGYGSMPDDKQQIPPRDRWAITAYIRALQLSQHFPRKDLTAEMRAEWEKENPGPGRPGK
jgi:hypothetical protein